MYRKKQGILLSGKRIKSLWLPWSVRKVFIRYLLKHCGKAVSRKWVIGSLSAIYIMVICLKESVRRLSANMRYCWKKMQEIYAQNWRVCWNGWKICWLLVCMAIRASLKKMICAVSLPNMIWMFLRQNVSFLLCWNREWRREEASAISVARRKRMKTSWFLLLPEALTCCSHVIRSSALSVLQEWKEICCCFTPRLFQT